MGTARFRHGKLAAPSGNETSHSSPTVTSEPLRPSPGRDAGSPAGSITLGEAACVILVVFLATAATASLVLAESGHHNGLVAVLVAIVATAGLASSTKLAGWAPAIELDGKELVLAVLVIVVAAWFFLPGFRYAFGDKDPGVYVAHAYVIEREGDTVIEDPITTRGLPRTYDIAGRFPGIWDAPGNDPNLVTSQFFPLFSATLATALDLGGESALFNLNPVLAIASVTVLTLTARRAFGTRVAVITSVLMVTSMMQVWQAKYPSTEILAQLLLSGSLLCGVLATRQRWTGGAFFGGLLLGTGFLARPDGFLYVIMAAALVATGLVVGHIDRRAAALGLGAGVTLPYAFYMAYLVKADYSAANQLPSPLLIVGGCALILGIGAVGRRLTRPTTLRRCKTWWQGRQPTTGLGLATVFGLILAGLALRPYLFEPDRTSHVLTGARSVRSYDELNVLWLSWFITPVGLITNWLGVVVFATRHRTTSQLLLIVPGAMLLPLYLYDARVSMRLMWWGRRFVPAVLPAVLLLIAIAISWALGQRRGVLQVAGTVVLGFLVLSFASQSLPLRHHQEMDGSWELAAGVAAFAGGEQGVFLYPQPRDDLYDPLANTPSEVWWIFDQVSARLPSGYRVDLIEDHQTAFPDQPVFLVTNSDLPERLPRDRFTLAGTVRQDLVVWEETTDHRPDQAERHPTTLQVWRYE